MTASTKQLYLEEMRDQGYSEATIDAFHTKMIPYVLEKYGVPKSGQLVQYGLAATYGVIFLVITTVIFQAYRRVTRNANRRASGDQRRQ